jgi:nitric oxide reductase subunit B
MASSRRLWLILFSCVVGAFLVLGGLGVEVYRQAPPIPSRVVTSTGRVLFTQDDILDGQQVWQSIGGQQVGSIWGHGAYQAPDWSADWLHREAVALRAHIAVPAGLDPATAEVVGRNRVQQQLRRNTFDRDSGTLTVSDERVAAIAEVSRHYDDLFGGAPALATLRQNYALSTTPIPDATRRSKLNAFFFWTAWACTTQRPGSTVTYTNNWPHEPLVGNQPTATNVIWSIVSVVLLLAGIGALVWWKAFRPDPDERIKPPASDPLSRLTLTPSMRACGWYIAAVAFLFALQVTMGALTAHYTVEGQSVYGFPLAEYIPYAVARTWHIQLGVFWIATAFLGAGLFLAPLVGGREPRHQRIGVLVLLGALVVVVLGSLGGEWLSIQQKLGLDIGFWFGQQGYEYVDLGRAWQIALFAGLILWLLLMIRALAPAWNRKDDTRNVVRLFIASTVAIGLMYGAGFFFSARSHLTVMEYWRWWVVHLWVEGFFEVFATAALAFLFVHLGLIRARLAGTAVLASSSLFLAAGIPGTFHHLYFSGTPTPIMAVGASFSALEVVPLVVVGWEAWRTWSLRSIAPWMARYRWAISCFLGVAFWNLVGAGLFGFLINPPISLYYLQGLNTTPVHAHTALFGVYGLLSIGLTLTMARVLTGVRPWREGSLALAFWGMNIGLVLMVVLSLLPIGIAQGYASVDVGLWYARSSDFLQIPIIQKLRWLRIVGDTVFLAGVGSFVWFLIGLKTGWSYREEHSATTEALAAATG